MGLSSNARLLTLTTRIRSNEYQSQRIANSKLRLSTESQDASAEYIKALNTQKMVYSTYDASSEPTNETLTTNVLYKYGEMKNQYILSNVHSQALVTKEDADNFEKSATLDEFLKANGIEKLYKTEELREAYEKVSSPEYLGYKKAYEEAKEEFRNKHWSDNDVRHGANFSAYLSGTSTVCEAFEEAFAKALGYDSKDSKDKAFSNFYNSNPSVEELCDFCKDNTIKGLAFFKEKYTQALDDPVDRPELDIWNETFLDQFKERYYTFLEYQDRFATVDTLIDYNMRNNMPETYDNMQKYNEAVAAFEVVKEKYGDNPSDWYTYDDPTKAQWYTNLWYRLNGESTLKSKDGLAKANYEVLDGRLLDSESWIRDALAQGVITVEQAKYDPNAQIDFPDKNTPTMFDLNGITWTSKMLSNCVDLKQVDDNVAITKAEAEYQRKTQEISAKDQKLTNKIRKLDSEHSSLEKAYEQAKNALKGDIDRSFGTFS